MTSTDVGVHEQADLSFVYAIHRALTEDAVNLARAAADLAPEDRSERIPTIRQYFTAYRTQLDSHHHHEDEVFFPALEAKVGADAMELDQLMTQHKGLDETLDRIGAALDAVGDERTEFAAAKARVVRAANELVAKLGDHLGLEERVVFPTFVLAVTQTENLALQARVQTMDPFEQLFFMVPWLFDRIPTEARRAALGAAPEVMRVIYLGHVQEYRELAQALYVRHG